MPVLAAWMSARKMNGSGEPLHSQAGVAVVSSEFSTMAEVDLAIAGIEAGWMPKEQETTPPTISAGTVPPVSFATAVEVQFTVDPFTALAVKTNAPSNARIKIGNFFIRTS